MSQMFETACRPFEAGAALSQHRRVKLSAGKLAYAGAGDVSIGTLEKPSFADGDIVAVRMRHAQGTQKMVASEAISLGAYVYGAADGKVAASGGAIEGIALEAAGANNDVIEVLPLRGGQPQTDHTANFTLTPQDSGSLHTTYGATGTVVATLPAATVGLEYSFEVGAAQELRLDPDGTETIALPSTGAQSAAGKYITANAAGEGVHIRCTKAGQWSVVSYIGTWTAEA